MHTAVLKEINSICECFSKEVIFGKFEAYFGVLEREVFHEVLSWVLVDFKSGHFKALLKECPYITFRQELLVNTVESKFVYLILGVVTLEVFCGCFKKD